MGTRVTRRARARLRLDAGARALRRPVRPARAAQVRGAGRDRGADLRARLPGGSGRAPVRLRSVRGHARLVRRDRALDRRCRQRVQPDRRHGRARVGGRADHGADRVPARQPERRDGAGRGGARVVRRARGIPALQSAARADLPRRRRRALDRLPDGGALAGLVPEVAGGGRVDRSAARVGSAAARHDPRDRAARAPAPVDERSARAHPARAARRGDTGGPRAPAPPATAERAVGRRLRSSSCTRSASRWRGSASARAASRPRFASACSRSCSRRASRRCGCWSAAPGGSRPTRRAPPKARGWCRSSTGQRASGPRCSTTCSIPIRSQR